MSVARPRSCRGLVGARPECRTDRAGRAETPLTVEPRYPCRMPAEFIYTSYKLARHYPPDRTVLEDISISFYPGAKIGVIGSNGAGKSSLLRIMAGLDDGFTGEARLTPGFTVGYLSQEPQLDPTKDVKQNVLDGVRPVQDLIDAYNAVMAKWSEPDADYEAIGAEQAALRGQDQRGRRLEPGAQRRHRHGRPALSARRRRRHDPVRWREATRGALPAAPPAPRPAPARRAHQPPRRRVGRVAGALPRRVRGHGRRRHPRSLLPGQRRQVDPGARSRAGHPLLRQLLELARAEARPDGQGIEVGRRQAAHARARARVGAHGRQGPPGQGQGPPDGLREAAGRGQRHARTRPASWRSPSRPGRAWATRSSRSRACARATATACSSRT